MTQVTYTAYLHALRQALNEVQHVSADEILAATSQFLGMLLATGLLEETVTHETGRQIILKNVDIGSQLVFDGVAQNVRH